MQATPLPAVEVGSHGRTGEAARSAEPKGWASARQARGLAQKTNRLTEPTMDMLSAAIQVIGPASGARECVHARLRFIWLLHCQAARALLCSLCRSLALLARHMGT